MSWVLSLLRPLIFFLIVTLSLSNTFSLFSESPGFLSGHYPKADQLDPVPSVGLLQPSSEKGPCQYLPLRDLNTPTQQEVARQNFINSFQNQIYIYIKGRNVRNVRMDSMSSHVRTRSPPLCRWLAGNSSSNPKDWQRDSC
jgi:hypothetical protein